MRSTQSDRQEEALTLMRELLGDNYLKIEVIAYELHEDFKEGSCRLTCDCIEQPGDDKFTIEGGGVGILDAFFHGLCARYETKHPSLKSIRFSRFSVRGLMGEGTGQASDAQAEAIVGVLNSNDTAFEFRALSPSVSHSSLEAVLEAVEYFVNAERAYVTAWKAMQYHRQQGRPELVSRYTDMLAVMVRNTSYSELLERLRAEER